jgi:hypothetical protein
MFWLQDVFRDIVLPRNCLTRRYLMNNERFISEKLPLFTLEPLHWRWHQYTVHKHTQLLSSLYHHHRDHRTLRRLARSRAEVTAFSDYHQQLQHYYDFFNYYWSRQSFGGYQMSTTHSWQSLVYTVIRIYVVTPDRQTSFNTRLSEATWNSLPKFGSRLELSAVSPVYVITDGGVMRKPTVTHLVLFIEPD